RTFRRKTPDARPGGGGAGQPLPSLPDRASLATAVFEDNLAGHGMPCRVCDVPGRVHISVARVTAGPAPVTRLALTRLPVHDPARRAPLTRVRGIDLHHPPGRLVLQALDQTAPSGRQDRPV